MATLNFYQAVYQVVRAIPRGRITTYGAVATWLGSPRAARAVGYALAADISSDIPWHRVINCRGQVSEGGAPWRADEQRTRLAKESVPLVAEERFDLNAAGFAPSLKQTRQWAALGKSLTKFS